MSYIKLFEEYQNAKNDTLEMIDYIENNSSFVLNNDKEEETLIFTTRANGSVSSEQHSEIDVKEARNLITQLKKSFDGFTYKIEIVDEWVDINVTKKDFYKDYEPDEDRVGYVLSYVRTDGVGHAFETSREFNIHSGRAKHRGALRRLAARFIKDMKPDEVTALADTLPIDRPNQYSKKVLIQKAHNSDSEEWSTIPNADFYVSRREIWK